MWLRSEGCTKHESTRIFMWTKILWKHTSISPPDNIFNAHLYATFMLLCVNIEIIQNLINMKYGPGTYVSCIHLIRLPCSFLNTWKRPPHELMNTKYFSNFGSSIGMFADRPPTLHPVTWTCCADVQVYMPHQAWLLRATYSFSLGNNLAVVGTWTYYYRINSVHL